MILHPRPVLFSRVALLAIFSLFITSPIFAQFAGGSGTPDDPYQIATASQLSSVRDNLGASYALAGDIDLSGLPFDPIGRSIEPFTGTFDGRSFTIKNWSYITYADNFDEANDVGLFASTGATAAIIHLRLDNVQVAAGNITGALVGENHGTIFDCQIGGAVDGTIDTGGMVGRNYGLLENNVSDVSVSCEFSHGSDIGGLVGSNFGPITNCVSTGDVSATQVTSYVGGLVGINNDGGAVQHSDASGNVSGFLLVGGLIGTNLGVVDTSYATGSVTGGGQAGGLVGGNFNNNSNNATVANSYATGNVTIQAYFFGSAGGLVGNCGTTTVNSYSTGAVSVGGQPMSQALGGLVGELSGFNLPVESCYWDIESSGQSVSASGTGKTTSEMQQQGSYVGWDFDNIWTISPNQYPTLRGDIHPTPVIIRQPLSQTIVYGQSATFSTAAIGAAPLRYQWQFNGQNIASATGTSFTIASVQTSDAGAYAVVVSNASASVTSTAASLTVEPIAPIVVTQPVAQKVALGQNVTLSVEPGGTPPFSYQWQLNGQDISGATGASYTIASAQPTDAGSYTVVVSNAVDSITSVPAILTVVGPPVFTLQPQDLTVRVGTRVVSFTGFVSSQAPVTYQWYFNGTPYQNPNGNSAFLSLFNVTAGNAGVYSLVVSNIGGSTTSNSATLTVLPNPPVVTSQPQSQTVSSGDDVILAVTATSSASLSYQWLLNNVDIPGATDQTLTLTAVTPANEGAYSVVVSNAGGSVTSNPAFVNVIVPQIGSLNPASVVGGSGAFVLAVNGSGFTSSAVVYWNGAARPTTFVDNYNLTAAIPATDIAGTSGITTALITVQGPHGVFSNAAALAVVPANVSVVLSNTSDVGTPVTVSSETFTSGDAGVTATLENNTAGTGTAAVTVANYLTNPTPVPSFDVGGKFVDVQVTGADATDTATAYFYYPDTITGITEANLVLQYYNGTGWQPVLSSGGATPVKETTDNLSDSYTDTLSGGRFTVVFDNTSTPKITELIGTVFTTSLKNTDTVPPVIQSLAASPALLTPANHKMVAVTINVTATDNLDPHPSSRIVSVTSNEPINGKGDGNTTPDWEITGALTLNLRAERADAGDGRIYTITVETKDAAGNKTTASTTVVVPKDENAAKHAPDISADPKDQKVTSGADVNFSVSVAPALPVTYQWRFNGKPIAGATATTLALHNVTMANAGNYAVAVTNINGTTVSKTANLTVVPLPPVITAAPQSQAANSGANVTFTVTATSEVAPTYQWLFKGKAIGGAKNASLTVTKVELSDAGSYSVEVSNDGGTITSAVATLTVAAPAIATLNPSTVTAGTAAFTLTVNGSGFAAGATVRWNGADRPTQFVNSTALTASISAGDIDNPKTVSITVRSASGDDSNPKPFTIALPHTPVITAGPSAQTASSGSNVTFTVTATSEVAPSYQWLFKGKAIGGAKGSSLTLAKVEASDSGAYSVVVSNDGGSVTSAAATLTVLAPTIATLNPTTIGAGGSAFTLTVSGANFVNGAVITWNGDDRVTQFVNSTTLTASIAAKDIPAKKKNGTTETVQIAVKSLSGDISNAKPLTISP